MESGQVSVLGLSLLAISRVARLASGSMPRDGTDAQYMPLRLYLLSSFCQVQRLVKLFLQFISTCEELFSSCPTSSIHPFHPFSSQRRLLGRPEPGKWVVS
jgi:hypothetical protein